MPISKDPGTNMKILKELHPDWPMSKIEAVGLNQARKAGAKGIKPPPPSTQKRRRGLGR